MVEEKDIANLNANSILSENVFLSLIEEDNEIDKARYEVLLTHRAKELGVYEEFDRLLKAYYKANQRLQSEYASTVQEFSTEVVLKRNERNQPLKTIENFLTILNGDKTVKNQFRLNELSGSPEKLVNGKIEPWTDADDSALRCYIEQTYKLFSAPKLDDAVRIKFQQHQYHPIRELIESIEWDGIPRLEMLLIKWLGAEDTVYSREVSRLIFAGGINRIYNPGCKFDEMPVLIGKRQGEGKSTFIRWLAIRDEFYREVTEIDGQRGIEALQGAWICEMSELLALKRAKEVEAVKSYVSRQVDTYRQPFDRRTSSHKRQCIFIGTTNNMEFLTDKTGNRRYLPVICNSRGRDLYSNEHRIKSDIMQCWAEALALFRDGKMHPSAKAELTDVIRSKQSEAVEDDYRVGMIEKYLEGKNEVCTMELWECALGEYYKPTKRDSNEIGLIMQSFEGWEKHPKTRRTEKYGSQRVWIRTGSGAENGDIPDA